MRKFYCNANTIPGTANFHSCVCVTKRITYILRYLPKVTLSLTSVTSFLRIADAEKLPGAELLAEAKREETKAKFEQNTADAIAIEVIRFAELCPQWRGVLGPDATV